MRRQLFGRVATLDRVFCAAVQGGSFLDEFNLAQGFVFDAARYLRRSQRTNRMDSCYEGRESHL